MAIINLMSEAKTNINLNFDEFGSPSRPVHITPKPSWNDATKELEDYIRDHVAIEGKWQSYVDGFKLHIPEQLQPIFSSGGVVTVSTERHLLLFGNVHWSRFQRLLSKEVGLSPVNNELARHFYRHMYRFNSLNEDGSISVPTELYKYAAITKDVAIIGMIYHAEVYDRQKFLKTEAPEHTASMLERFRRIKLN